MWMLGVLPWLCVCVALLSFAPSRCEAEAEPQTVTAYSENDDNAPTPDMIRKAGYRCEIHTVTTEDGYILNLHRIPGGRSKGLNSSLAPVFLQHGLLDSSADWVLTGPGKSLSYILADLGYDVWLGNARGNVYSRGHTTFPTEDLRYWNWTWHEMGYYDLPAVLDYVLEVTGHRQIHYVGHSMGTTMFFVLCATRPEYNAKIRSMTALAPVAFMGHVTSPIRYLAPYAHSFEEIAEFFGAGAFLPRTCILDKLIKYACELAQFERRVCENYVFLLCGYDPAQFDEKLLPLILGHNPAGESTKTLVHYAQEINSHLFQQYDYGAQGNPSMYNSSHPPQYNLSLVTAPVSLIYAENDLLAAPVDVNELFKLLKNPVGMFRVNLTSFNHLDFLWGKDADTLVYDQVMYLLEKFEDESIRCVKPKEGVKNGVVEVEAQPCPSSLVKNELRGGKGQLKSFMRNNQMWRNSVLSNLRSLSAVF